MGESEPLESRPDQLATVMDIARAVGSTLDLDTLLLLVMERVTTLVEADRSTLYIVDPDQGELWSKVAQGDDVQEIRLKIGTGIAGWVASTGEAVHLHDAYDDDRFDRHWDTLTGYRTQALLAVPLRNKDHVVVAVIQCLNKPGGFTDADQELLEAVGGQVAIAIDNALLYRELVERNEALRRAEASLRQANAELEILYDVEIRLSRARSADDLVRIALQRVCHHFRAEGSAMLLDVEDNPRVVAFDPATDTVYGRPVKPGIARALVEKLHMPVKLAHETLEAEVADALATVAGIEVRDALSTGLAVQRRTIGVLQVANHGLDRDYEQAVLRLLALIGAQVARALQLERARTSDEQAERLSLIGQAVSAILHDMRTPMGAIEGYAELMAETGSESERQSYVERIRRAMSHMEGMTREVLGFARGEREVLLGSVHLNRFVPEVVELLRPDLERAGVALVVEDRYRGAARFDANKVRRVVANLARNACQAMGAGGTFTWTIDRKGDTLVMGFEDDGPGIPVEIRDSLFQFFATHGRDGGTGLGLAMAKRIVEAHGGTIACTRTGPDGTAFRIRLPLGSG